MTNLKKHWIYNGFHLRFFPKTGTIYVGELDD